MTIANRKMILWAAGMIGFGGSPASAELAMLQDKDWLGYFVGTENKKMRFAVSSKGKGVLNVIGKNGGTNQQLKIPVEFLLEETLPDGKIYERSILPESLESAQPPTTKPQNVVIRGKVKGDASIEITVHEDRGMISLGGRLLDAGSVKNPLRFSIQFQFPNAYPYETAGKKEDNDKKDKRGDKKADAFEEKMENDRLTLVWTDGKRVKPSTTESVEAGSREINGPGISAAQLEFSYYAGKKLDLVASPNSAMALSSKAAAPLHKGFTMIWVADPAKDPEGKARINFEMK